MKRCILVLFLLLPAFAGKAQTYIYHPFPTDTCNWSCMTWGQWSPTDISIENIEYQLEGDTIISGKEYLKVFSFNVDYSFEGREYIGGLREDSLKNIYFFPESEYIPNYCSSHFPSDTAEYLLYTFDSLYVGKIVPINVGNTEIMVTGIDSVLIGNQYRKRYEIQQSNLLFGPQYWIEGIGSTKNLFAPYSYEFEWSLYTLCFTDSETYYLQSSFGNTCYVSISIGIEESPQETLQVYPNPANDVINCVLPDNKEYEIVVYDAISSVVTLSGPDNYRNEMSTTEGQIITLNISHLPPGIYFIEARGERPDSYRDLRGKFVKE